MDKSPVILLIDDDEHSRCNYQAVLQDDYTVIAATNSHDAPLFYAMAHPDIDLVVFDANIFFCNGSKSIMEMRSVNPNIRCLAITPDLYNPKLSDIMRFCLSSILCAPFTDKEL
ncbi:MAG: response regulator, partial [Planctomycetes bacterium]|nr:response regulator [Planctomycetota bacterium]